MQRGVEPIEWPQWTRRVPVVGSTPGSALRDTRTAAILGIALGVTFGICFLTGLFSHWAQSPDPIIDYPARPAGLYRITQATHVFTGVASIPLLLAKLWTVLPSFFRLPPIVSVAHGVERAALLPLVGGSLFLLISGVNNIAAWYPWEFNFVVAHYWAAWITIGALVAHIGAKITTARAALRRSPDGSMEGSTQPPPTAGGLRRRGFLAVVGATAAGIAASVESQSISVFQRIGFLSPRDLDIGVQGLPVNSSARRRRVTEAAQSDDYRLVVTGNVDRELSLDLADLRAMDQREAELPIACVEGWSKSAHWRGVSVADLLARAGARDGATATVVSLQERGAFRSSLLNAAQASDPDTLLALELNGETLHLDHGFPVRLIGPNRPGVNQTKWVTEVRVR